jgi:putative membrane protein
VTSPPDHPVQPDHRVQPDHAVPPDHPVPPGLFDRTQTGVTGEGWQRLHPLSPVLRGGVVALAMVGFVLTQGVDRFFSSVGGPFWNGSPDPDAGPRPGGGTDVTLDPGDVLEHPLLAGGAGLLVVAAVVAWAWVSWRFSVFRVTPRQVELRTGWLFRQHRQVPLERVQAVDVSRPLLAQLLGLAQVVVQSAGGRDAKLKLAFLQLDRAEAVRDHLLDLAARAAAPRAPAPHDARPEGADLRDAAPGAPGGAPAWRDPTGSLSVLVTGGPDPGRPVLAVPNSRLLLATVLHGSTVVLLGMVLLGVAVAAGLAGRRSVLIGFLGSLPAIGPVLLGVALGRTRELMRHGNFRLSDLGGSLRIRHGLTDQRTTTVPLHRVQAMELVQPLWWRPFGWWRVRVNVAGVHGDDDDPTNETVMLPVGPLEEALGVLTLVDPRLSADLLARAALGDGDDGGWTLVSPRARPLDPLSWRRNGYAVTREALLLRRGRLTRSVVAVPHARIQSLGLSQGPLDRRLGLAGVRLVSTPGPVSPRLDHLALHEAHRLLAEEAARSRAARGRLPVRLHDARGT